MINRKQRPVLLMSLLALTFTWGPLVSRAESAALTAQDHRAKVDMYKKQAADYRAVAEEHRKMLADYKKEVPAMPKSQTEDPRVAKMRKHCEGLIQNAEAAAVDADKLAEYHELRAKEAEGK